MDLKNEMRCGLDWSGSEYENVADSREQGNVPLWFFKIVEGAIE